MNIEKLPFHKFCVHIGAIPTSYIESLSYYELLLWFCKFLEKQVIPTVDHNGEVVEELQNLFNELQSYITNYFDNLDVQNEINNKLDKMVEDGTIQNILFNYANIARIYNNKNDLFNDKQNLSINEKIILIGNENTNDIIPELYVIRNYKPNSDYIDFENGLFAEKSKYTFIDFKNQDDIKKYNDTILRNGKIVVVDYTYGNYENGAILTVRANNTNSKSPITGDTTQNLAMRYGSRDSVAFVADNDIKSYLYKLSTSDIIEITHNSITVNENFVDNVKIGMFIDFNKPSILENHYLAKIIDIQENKFIVDGWFDNQGTGVTPNIANLTDGLYINAITKIWGTNIIVKSKEDEEFHTLIGTELEVRNQNADDTSSNRGIDLVGSYFKNTVGILIRGHNNNGNAWVYGINARKSDYGFTGQDNSIIDFQSLSPATIGFLCNYNENKIPFEFIDALNVHHNIQNNGINNGFILGNKILRASGTFSHNNETSLINEYQVAGNSNVMNISGVAPVGRKIKLYLTGTEVTINNENILFYFSNGVTSTKTGTFTATKQTGGGIIELTYLPDNNLCFVETSPNITIS